jgi:hypothetical protein
MRALATALLLAAACSRSEVAPLPAAGSATPAAPAGSGSGSAAANPDLDAIVADTLSYTAKMVPILAAFDGDCAKHVDRLLTLEPLVIEIRKRTADLAKANPDIDKTILARLRAHGAEVKKQVDAQLAILGKTQADLDKMEGELNAKCAADQKFQDAMGRIGVFKRPSDKTK